MTPERDILKKNDVLSGPTEVKYAFIRDHRDQFDVTIMCEIFGVSRSGYYDWVTRDHESREGRLLKLRIDMEKAFHRSFFIL